LLGIKVVRVERRGCLFEWFGLEDAVAGDSIYVVVGTAGRVNQFEAYESWFRSLKRLVS